MDFKKFTYSQGRNSFEVNKGHGRNAAQHQTSLNKLRDTFLTELLANIRRARPQPGSLIDSFSVFDLELAPPPAEIAAFVSDQTLRLKNLYDRLQNKTVLMYDAKTDEAITVPHQNLLPKDYTFFDFCTSFRLVLPTMYAHGNNIRSKGGAARIRSLGSASFSLEPDEKETFADITGEPMELLTSHESSWASILRRFINSQPEFCEILKIMLTYQVKSSKLSRLISFLPLFY